MIDARRWHILTVYDDTEFKVEREAKALGLATCVPKQRSFRRITGKQGRPMLIEKPEAILPNYVLIGAHGEVDWPTVRRIKGVEGRGWLVDSSGRPAHLTDADVDRIRVLLRENARDARRGWQRGDAIRVLKGPFKGLEAIIEAIRPEGVTIAVELFGKTSSMLVTPDAMEAA